jgi:hypothetical protein
MGCSASSPDCECLDFGLIKKPISLNSKPLNDPNFRVETNNNSEMSHRKAKKNGIIKILVNPIVYNDKIPS